MWLGLALFWLIIQLPYPLLLRLGRLLGRIMYRFADERKYIVQRNLQLCLGHWTEKERTQLLKENFASYGIAFFEMGMSWWWSKKRLRRLVKVEGLENLQKAQQRGQGVILMAIHFTTLEIGAALLGQLHTIDGMYRAHKNPVFNYVQRRGRERHNKDSIAIEREEIRLMFRQLREGRAIWYAPDQDYGAKQSVFVPLFGVKAATVTATSTFARLGRAAVLPMRQTRLANGRGYLIEIEPPLDNFPSEDVEQDCLRINQWVEQAITAQPEQYLWAHRRFKTRPEGEGKLY